MRYGSPGSTVSTGRYNPSLLLAFQLARLFNMTVEELFLYEEEEK